MDLCDPCTNTLLRRDSGKKGVPDGIKCVLGAVLLKEDGRKPPPVVYISEKLESAKINAK